MIVFEKPEHKGIEDKLCVRNLMIYSFIFC